MIQIKSQTALHQYDGDGRIITTWDDSRCAWIVEPEFEKERIDWYGEDSDFAGGTTLAEYTENNPNYGKSRVNVMWTWKTKESFQAAFGHPRSFGQSFDYYDKQSYPQMVVRSWDYMDIPKEETVSFFGTYAKFHTGADNVVVRYNNEVLYDGPGKDIPVLEKHKI